VASFFLKLLDIPPHVFSSHNFICPKIFEEECGKGGGRRGAGGGWGEVMGGGEGGGSFLLPGRGEGVEVPTSPSPPLRAVVIG